MNLEEYSNKVKIPQEKLAKHFEISEQPIDGSVVLAIPYWNKESQLFRTRYRQQDKRWWSTGEGLIPYGLNWLSDKTDYIILAEGESDTQVLLFHDYPTLGIPGASTFKPEWISDYLMDKTLIYLAVDNDEAGNKLANHIVAKAKQVGYSGAIKRVKIPKELNGKKVKDINDLCLYSFNFKQAFDELLSQAEIVKAEGFDGGWDDENLTSTLRDTPVEEVFKRVNGAELKAAEPIELPFLPFLGEDGYIVRNWSHVISGAPKAGKTELVTRLIQSWNNDKILYLTEEPMGIWQERVQRLAGDFSHVNFVSPLGLSPEQLLDGIEQGEETVVIVDTLRTILGIRDEKDNSLITQQLVPLISMCRDKEQTLILLHHHRKQGGEYGEALSGGHALLGLVDRAIELTRDPNSPNRRIIKGVGRLIPVPEVVYELQDTDLVIIGSPKDLTIEAVKQEVHIVLLQLPGTMLTIKAIREKMDEPKPSSEQARRALNELFLEKKIERDPKEETPGKTYKYGILDDSNNLLQPSLSIGGGKVEEKGQDEQLSVEQIKDMFNADEEPPGAPF